MVEQPEREQRLYVESAAEGVETEQAGERVDDPLRRPRGTFVGRASAAASAARGSRW
jgi:hypothetical protein